MKKHLPFLLIIPLLGFFSCQKERITETPGNIPGFGDAPGPLEIKERFVLPEGIVLSSEILGRERESQQPALKSSNNSYWSTFGSGNDVVLTLTLKNESRTPKTLFLPKGLIWESVSGTYQHGLQIQTIWISLLPGVTKKVTIHLYCANLNLPQPDQNAIYRILGVSNSKIIWKFLDLVGWKIVNYEMIESGPKSNQPLKSGNTPSFHDISERMQRIIEKLTDNGEPISEEDKEFIERIPDVEDPIIRPLLEKNATYHEYLEEYRDLINK